MAHFELEDLATGAEAMAHLGIQRLAGETKKVRLKVDQIVRGTIAKKGDTADLPTHEAKHLVNIDRAELVVEAPKPAEPAAPTK